MVDWLSSYNYDYVLASIPIQIIMLIFYCARRNLPMRSSRTFLLVMISNLIMTIFDIVACELNAIWTQIPLWVAYLTNQIYFWAFIARGWYLFDYTFEESQAYQSVGRTVHIAALVPAIAASLFVLFTPWTSTIFTFDAEIGYRSCEMYPIIYYCTYFYIGASLICVLLRIRKMRPRLVLSMFGYNAILIVGIILRKAFMNTLVTSYFSILAILVIYLSVQNPDLFRDKNTNLFNRDAFERIVNEYLQKRTPFHCIVIAMQSFDSAKAVYGQRQLNYALRTAGAWMVSSFPGYYVFYYGNGNFLMLKQREFDDKDSAIFEKIDERFLFPWEYVDSEVPLLVSTMVLPWRIMPKDHSQIEDLAQFAAANAYVENKRGNHFVTESLSERIVHYEKVEAALGRALDQKAIEIYLQPIVSADTQQVVFAEALARLHDPELGFIPPDEFIRMAEQSGDIKELGSQIFEKVCLFVVSHDLQSLGIRKINVNLSPAQCMNDQLAFELHAIAERYGIPMSMIEFEVTETSFEDYLLIQKQLISLQEYGATFSLDDFGTGTSNLVRLMNLPIQIVKLDKTLIDSYFEGELMMLPDLVNMFHKAGMKIVVEGVETSEMKAALEDMGADYEQGYYFSRPIPTDVFAQKMQEDWRRGICAE